MSCASCLPDVGLPTNLFLLIVEYMGTPYVYDKLMYATPDRVHDGIFRPNFGSEPVFRRVWTIENGGINCLSIGKDAPESEDRNT